MPLSANRITGDACAAAAAMLSQWRLYKMDVWMDKNRVWGPLIDRADPDARTLDPCLDDGNSALVSDSIKGGIFLALSACRRRPHSYQYSSLDYFHPSCHSSPWSWRNAPVSLEWKSARRQKEQDRHTLPPTESQLPIYVYHAAANTPRFEDRTIDHAAFSPYPHVVLPAINISALQFSQDQSTITCRMLEASIRRPL